MCLSDPSLVFNALLFFIIKKLPPLTTLTPAAHCVQPMGVLAEQWRGGREQEVRVFLPLLSLPSHQFHLHSGLTGPLCCQLPSGDSALGSGHAGPDLGRTADMNPGLPGGDT